METLILPCDAGEVSDGNHTFNELYDHRCSLMLALMASIHEISWISEAHNDGETIDGWFIVGMDLPTGTITYHMPSSMMDLAIQTGAEVLEKAKPWDGHTTEDVVERLREFVKWTVTPT